MKKEKKIYGQSSTQIIKQNEKIIKYATIFCVAYSIIYIVVFIAWVYCKINNL
jgi:hypothetical protein